MRQNLESSWQSNAWNWLVTVLTSFPTSAQQETDFRPELLPISVGLTPKGA